LGIQLSFLALSLFFVSSKFGGESLGVGFQFQNPYFVIFMLLLVFVMGLSFFGVFHLEGPNSNLLYDLTQRGGWQGPFFQGALLTVLSTPCTAPLLGAAYAWALFWALAPLVWAAVAASGRPRRTRPLIHRAARLLLRLTGTPLKVSGLEHLPRTPCVLAVNHASYLDGILLSAALPPDLPHAYVAKREFVDHFVPRLFLRGIGAVFVERFDAQLGVEHVEDVAGALEQGASPVFFPEGTFDRRPGLLAFRSGAFAVAAKAGVPVVPVAIRGARSMLRGGDWFPYRGAASIRLGAAIRSAGSEWRDVMLLRDQVRAEILRHCGEPDLAQ
jgi:1-acyl-sn-glycerol-3-phosphate acyltransferase